MIKKGDIFVATCGRCTGSSIKHNLHCQWVVTCCRKVTSRCARCFGRAFAHNIFICDFGVNWVAEKIPVLCRKFWIIEIFGLKASADFPRRKTKTFHLQEILEKAEESISRGFRIRRKIIDIFFESSIAFFLFFFLRPRTPSPRSLFVVDRTYFNRLPPH